MSEKQYKSPLVSCICCREVKSAKGIFSHYSRSHGTEDEKKKYKSGLSNNELQQIKQKNLASRIVKWKTYYANPSCCQECGSEFDWFKRNDKFCNKTCSAKTNNISRIVTDDSNQKRSESLKKYHSLKVKKIKTPVPKKVIPEVVGPFTKIYKCTCKHCQVNFYKPTVKQICINCAVYANNAYYKFKFNFSVYDYPELFNLELLNIYGWWSNGRHGGAKNPGGISRDHKISVSNAIKHAYDPYYISHPLNCELMFHSANQQKHARSSLSYDELVKMVNEYDIIHSTKAVAHMG